MKNHSVLHPFCVMIRFMVNCFRICGVLKGLEEYSWDQIFFLSFGSVWCMDISEDTLRSYISGGSHSPGASRINGTLQNNPWFGEAFGCPPGSNMNPSTKCSVW